VAVGGPAGGVVAALGAGDACDVLVEQGAEHLQPHPHGEGQQALARFAREGGELDRHPVRNLDLVAARLPAERNRFNLGHWRFLLLSTRDLSRVEDRHLHFYGSRHNLLKTFSREEIIAGAHDN